MSDWTPRAGARAAGGELGESAAERAAREERHQVIIDLVGAYADGELPPETTSQIDAHLVGCGRCRRDLALHQAVRRRLGVEPLAAAPPALRERIAAAVAAIAIALGGVAALTWIGVARQESAAVSPALGQLASSPASVPLIRAILAD